MSDPDLGVNKITEEEINAIREHAEKLKQATAESDKALTVRRIMELENQNFILALFNKYSLKLGVDKVYYDGVIERFVEPPKPVEAVKEAEVATQPETSQAKRTKKGNKDG